MSSFSTRSTRFLVFTWLSWFNQISLISNLFTFKFVQLQISSNSNFFKSNFFDFRCPNFYNFKFNINVKVKLQIQLQSATSNFNFKPQPQFITSSPSPGWAWPSSAPACFRNFEPVLVINFSFKPQLQNSNLITKPKIWLSLAQLSPSLFYLSIIENKNCEIDISTIRVIVLYNIQK